MRLSQSLAARSSAADWASPLCVSAAAMSRWRSSKPSRSSTARSRALDATVGGAFDRGARGGDHLGEVGGASVGRLREPVLGPGEGVEELVPGDDARLLELARVLLGRGSQSRFEL